MKPTTFAVLSRLVFLALAVQPRDEPTGISKDRSGRTVLTYNAKFDDVSTALLPGAPVRGIQGLGVYDNLHFNNLGVAVDNAILASIPPVSPPHVLGFDTISSLEGPQNITSIWDGSLVEFFSLQDFYMGCLLSTQETASSVPIACNVRLTGSRNGKLLGTYVAEYDPKSLLSAQMTHFQVQGKFSEVDTIVLEKEGSLLDAAVTVLLDNIGLSMTLKKGI